MSEVVNSTPPKVMLVVSALPIATTAAPAVVASAPTLPLKVIAPVPEEPIVRSPTAVVAPILESITVVPVPLSIVKFSALAPAVVPSIVAEKSIFPPPVPLLIATVPPELFKTTLPTKLIFSPSVVMPSLIVIVPVLVKLTAPMSV